MILTAGRLPLQPPGERNRAGHFSRGRPQWGAGATGLCAVPSVPGRPQRPRPAPVHEIISCCGPCQLQAGGDSGLRAPVQPGRWGLESGAAVAGRMRACGGGGGREAARRVGRWRGRRRGRDAAAVQGGSGLRQLAPPLVGLRRVPDAIPLLPPPLLLRRQLQLQPGAHGGAPSEAKRQPASDWPRRCSTNR